MSEVVRQLKIKTKSVERHAAPCNSARLFPSAGRSDRVCPRRMGKDLDTSAKEMARQEKRIEEYKADPGRDEYDVKKQVGSLHPPRAPRPHAQNPRASRAQVEVLGEYQAGRTDEFERLKKYRDDLHVFLVRPPRRHRRIARASARTRARACSTRTGTQAAALHHVLGLAGAMRGFSGMGGHQGRGGGDEGEGGDGRGRPSPRQQVGRRVARMLSSPGARVNARHPVTPSRPGLCAVDAGRVPPGAGGLSCTV